MFQLLRAIANTWYCQTVSILAISVGNGSDFSFFYQNLLMINIYIFISLQCISAFFLRTRILLLKLPLSNN